MLEFIYWMVAAGFFCGWFLIGIVIAMLLIALLAPQIDDEEDL